MASAPGEGLLASIELWPLNWAPVGYAECNGALLPITQYQALFALLGTTYGGNGSSNFGLPNLQGRVPLGMGMGPTGVQYNVGDTGGSQNLNISIANLPPHVHGVTVNVTPKTFAGGRGAVTTPDGNFNGPSTTSDAQYGPAGSGVMGSSPAAVTENPVGNGQPLSLPLPPYQVINYIIATMGYFPERP